MPNLTETDLEWLNGTFPAEFDFYNLGKIEILPGEPSNHLGIYEEEEFDSAQDGQILGFKLYGDFSAWLVLVLEQQTDPDTYAELGNILASKIATELYALRNWDVMVTPPEVLTSSRFRQLAKTNPLAVRRTYLHRLRENRILPVEVTMIPELSEGTGYA